MKKILDPVKGKTFPVFCYYALPSVISMLAVSCAVVIDGFFIGNYGGSDSLAAVNLTVPVSAVFIGISLMLSVGGAVRCGRYLGKSDFDSANAIFSQVLILTLIIALVISVTGIVFTDSIVRFLGANDVIALQTEEYLRILLIFNVFQMSMVGLSYFLRVDGWPLFAAGIMIAGSALNIVLDWAFIVELGMGHKGAAIGTGLSELVTFLFLCTPFIMKKTNLKFNWNTSDLSEAFKSAYNGCSEFSNEVSAGMITFVFN